MTGALLLAGYAAATGFLAPAALSRGWAARAPRLAVGLWLALPVSWVAATALAVLGAVAPLALSWPVPGTGRSPAAMAVHGTAGGRAVAVAGLMLAATVVLRAASCVARGLARGRRERRAHAAFLHVAGRPDRVLGAVILDDDAPVAYCLPGGRHRVVVSAGALDALGPGQLHAVIAHERAHLRGHHHVALAAAVALGHAFPPVPLLAQAGKKMAVLAEMAADDAAARHHDPAELAAALVVLARAGARTATLSAGGPAAVARIQRLLAPPPRPGRLARIARRAVGATALMLAAAVGCLPLLAAACDVAGRI